jgi:hypothetical protein
VEKLAGRGRMAVGSGIADEQATDVLELLHSQSLVGVDGMDATITLQTITGPIELSVHLDQMAAAGVEFGQAGILMLRRQMMGADHGKEAFEDLMRSAPKPDAVTPIIDPLTGECVVVYRFADRLPFMVRLTMEQIAVALDLLSSEIKRTSN